MAPRHCLVLLFVLLLANCAAASARQAMPPAALDLAAMVLSSADLAAAGWDDLELTTERALSVEDLADRAIWPAGAGDELDEVRDALLAAGWQQGYGASFATIWDPNRADPGHQVEVEIVAYADEEGAARGFALVPDVYPTGPVESIPGTHRIGDESRLVRVDARDPQAGVPNQELALGFRHGRLTARILLRDWSGGEPAVATIEALAERMLARLGCVQEGNSEPNLVMTSERGVGQVGGPLRHGQWMPSGSRRSTRPGVARVCSPPSTTGTPLTSTYGMPTG